uniref:MSP domain-containing protein n=1 Tax=Caenorhabditis japonica TaxID=281687 RepID=A0A8R1I463_CAEJA
MTSPVCKVFDKSIDSSQKISSNNKEYRITPVGSKDVAISRNTEAPKKNKPLVQFAPAPADALAAFAFVPSAGTLTITVSVCFETPLKK